MAGAHNREPIVFWTKSCAKAESVPHKSSCHFDITMMLHLEALNHWFGGIWWLVPRSFRERHAFVANSYDVGGERGGGKGSEPLVKGFT